MNLDVLINLGYIKKCNDFYLLVSSPESNIERRLNGNANAEIMLKQAYIKSKRISAFPFISGICISGGLSKKYYDDHSDIDYFIITKPNRLWICRTLFILFFKTLSKDKKKQYCLNYFISEADLQINDYNIFVATELAYLLPTVNYKVYQQLIEKNNWYKTQFPNKAPNSGNNCLDTHEPLRKRIVENTFAGKFGNWIDDQLLKITLQRWRKKYPKMKDEIFELQFRSRKHVCKRHEHGYQGKVLNLFNEKIKEFENNVKLKIS